MPSYKYFLHLLITHNLGLITNIEKMIQKVSVPVSVTMQFDHRQKKAAPKCVLWEGKVYPIKKIGLHHTYRAGRTLSHVFSVESETLFFRLVFDTDNLSWVLEEISDGEPS